MVTNMDNKKFESLVEGMKKIHLDTVIDLLEKGQELDVGDKLLIKNILFQEIDNYVAQHGEVPVMLDCFDWIRLRDFGYSIPDINRSMYSHICEVMDDKYNSPAERRELLRRKIEALQGQWR